MLVAKYAKMMREDEDEHYVNMLRSMGVIKEDDVTTLRKTYGEILPEGEEVAQEAGLQCDKYR